MDWKSYYAKELASPNGRATVGAALARHADGDARIQAVLQAGGLVSFPHVTLQVSADPIARTVQSIFEMGAHQVIALGVLHGGTLPAAYRAVHAALSGTGAQAEAALRHLGGAFVARGEAQTPFGCIESGRAPAGCDFIHEDAMVLSGEFSLDLFLALLAAAARARGIRPPAVTRLYVSATRSPDGGFQRAAALAAAIRARFDSDTVCLATGDLAHIGNAYTPAAEVAALVQGEAALTDLLLPQIGAMHTAALAGGDFAAAFAWGTRLMSDQRHLLPVIAELLGPNATAELLSFRLADYAGINGVPPPCFVAAALTLFRPAAS